MKKGRREAGEERSDEPHTLAEFAIATGKKQKGEKKGWDYKKAKGEVTNLIFNNNISFFNLMQI